MKTNVDTLVILAGGASSRMKRSSLQEGSSLSKEELLQANARSKGLILLGKQQRPLLDYVLYNAQKAGYKKIVFLINQQGELFRSYYGEEQPFALFNGLEIYYAVQKIPEGREKPLGTADALQQAMDQQPWLKTSRFTVCNSDNLYSQQAFSLLSETPAPNAFISYDRDGLKFSTERIERFALVRTNPEGQLMDIVEKPGPQERKAFTDRSGKLRVSMNIFMFSGADIYPFLVNCPLHPQRNEKELPVALLHMVRSHPGSVLSIPLSEHVPDLTSKEDIAIMRSLLDKTYPTSLWQH